MPGPAVTTLTAELQNLHYATSRQEVDRLNSEFYGNIRYPWPPQYFERVQRADLAAQMLAQDVGCWHGALLPAEPRIWVAGCGTNQALFTALRFQHGLVLGSDLSAASLAVCRANAESLGAGNLELRCESINETSYTGCFDYVICTGVIQCNADPALPLTRLAEALAPGGLLELMVYNRFHRILTAAFQNALWLLVGKPAQPDLARERPVARRLVETFRHANLMSQFLAACRDLPDAAFADSLLQPVEHSHTVASLEQLARRCGLEILTSCNDAFSRTRGDADWNLELEDLELRRLYEALPDLERWQITNLLLAEASPMLWFYLQRRDCPRPRKPERQLCAEFLDTRFRRVETQKELFVREPDGSISASPRLVAFPGAPLRELPGRVYHALDETLPLRDTLSWLDVDVSFPKLNRLRLALATSGCPYLEAVSR
jgi:SAM-dependent methyltransferase